MESYSVDVVLIWFPRGPPVLSGRVCLCSREAGLA